METFNYNKCKIYSYKNNKTKLQVYVAIHQLHQGRSTGGCRFVSYNNEKEAVEDATKLATAMSAKNALANLPFGGAKAVIVKPKEPFDRSLLFESYGQFLNALNGRYVTGCDSGVSQDDMRIVNSISPYVVGLPENGVDYLIECTAAGILQAMRSSIKYRLNKETFDGLKVVIQGVGKVGFELARLLTLSGARVVVSDINSAALSYCLANLPVDTIDPDQVFKEKSDIFAPCALGGVITNAVASRVDTKIICGAANNPLADFEVSKTLHERGVAFIPDYIANSGGAIYVVRSYLGDNPSIIQSKVEETVSKRAGEVLNSARVKNISPLEVAQKIAMNEVQHRKVVDMLGEIRIPKEISAVA